MKNVVFILLLAIGGSMGQLLDQCNVQKCQNTILRDQIAELEGLPPPEGHLKTLCPLVLEAMNCASDQIKNCTGQSIEELAVSGNKTVSELMITLSSFKGISRDVCNEDSTLHKNYVSGISCFRNMIRETRERCFRQGNKIYEAYKETLLELVDAEEAECMVIGYGIACVSKELRETCGGTASDAFLEIIKRLKFMKLNYCQPKHLLTLKTKFLDYVEEQGEPRDIFASAFDFRRRK